MGFHLHLAVFLWSYFRLEIVRVGHSFQILDVKSIPEDVQPLPPKLPIHQFPVDYSSIFSSFQLHSTNCVNSSCSNCLRPASYVLILNIRLCFKPFVRGAQSQYQREAQRRCELVHSWVNQTHYHQIWSYGFAVLLIGRLRTTWLMCTVNQDKSCLF